MKPMSVDQVAHDELENWARVVRDPRFIPRTCYSAEGRYRPERVKDGREREQTAKPAPEIQAGLLSERVICHPAFPRAARDMLVSYYVKQASKSQVCRRCAVPMSAFDERIGWAARVFMNRLDKARRSVDTMHSDNSIPPSGAYAA